MTSRRLRAAFAAIAACALVVASTAPATAAAPAGRSAAFDKAEQSDPACKPLRNS